MQPTSVSVQPKPAAHTDTPQEILRFAADALRAGQGCVLITLVRIIDGAPRALGAHMAVRADGAYCGYVSGGCIEAAVAAEALVVLAQACDRTERFGKGSRFFDLTLPCGGGLDLSFHVLREADPVEAVLRRLEARRDARLSYDPETGRLTEAAGSDTDGWHEGRFVTSYRPALRIILIGSGFEAQSFATLARAAGLSVLTPSRDEIASLGDPATAVVFLRHDLDNEVPSLLAALGARAFYIGCLGGRRTHRRRVDALLAHGVSQDRIDRIHAPIGLFGPARSVQALACSVLAEVMAKYEGATSRTEG